MKIDVIAPLFLASLLAAPASAADWKGFYAGADLGYASAKFETQVTDLYVLEAGGGVPLAATNSTLATLDTKPGGWSVGAHGGYNWQSGQLVYGVEGDLTYISVKKSGSGSITVPGYPQDVEASAEVKLSMASSLRGRLGFLATPEILVYGTAGLTYDQVEVRIDQALVPNSLDTATWQARTKGWELGWTAGFGAEYALKPRTTLRFECTYFDLGTFEVGTLATEVGGLPFTTQQVEADVKGYQVKVGFARRF